MALVEIGLALFLVTLIVECSGAAGWYLEHYPRVPTGGLMPNPAHNSATHELGWLRRAADHLATGLRLPSLRSFS